MNRSRREMTPAVSKKNKHGSILVVDDDRDHLFLVRRLLEIEGIEAFCEGCGDNALKRLSEREFSAMLTDYNMPGMDGFELAQKAHAVAPDLIVIMSTGEPTPEICHRAQEIGIVKLFSKPIDIRELIATLHEHGCTAHREELSPSAVTVAESSSEYSSREAPTGSRRSIFSSSKNSCNLVSSML